MAKRTPPGSDRVKLQSLRSVRFWTSLGRNCLNFPAMSPRTRGNSILLIKYLPNGARLDTSVSFQFFHTWIQIEDTDRGWTERRVS